jgi:hypothetical protein
MGSVSLTRHAAHRCYEQVMGSDATVKQCRECAVGRPHCHGTLIHHLGQKPQCTDPDCSHPEVLLHSLIVDCDAIGCLCGEHWHHQLAL